MVDGQTKILFGTMLVKKKNIELDTILIQKMEYFSSVMTISFNNLEH